MMFYSTIINLLFITSIVYSAIDSTIVDDKNHINSRITNNQTIHEICNVYLIPSLIPMAGRGVISGKHYRPKQRIELVPTIVISNKVTSVTQLQNYVFATEEDDYDMICLGAGSLYNHHQSESVQHYWNSHNVATFSSTLKYPHTTFTKTSYNTLRSVQLGEELFVNYGEGWFVNRFNENSNTTSNDDAVVNIDEVDVNNIRIRNDHDSMASDDEYSNSDDEYSNSDYEYSNSDDEYSNSYDDEYSDDELDHTAIITDNNTTTNSTSSVMNVTYIEEADLITYGHCINNVYVANSTIPNIGSGLFANKDFMINDTVTISPVLFLHKDIVLKEPGVLLNYCYGTKDSNVLLFPLNYGGSINHPHSALHAESQSRAINHPHSALHAESQSRANVKLNWYDWNPASLAIQNKYKHNSYNNTNRNNTSSYMELNRILNKSIEELLNYSFAPLDIVYQAIKPINKHEEIFLDYGEEWIKNYLIYINNLDIISNLYNKTCDHGLDHLNYNNKFCSIENVDNEQSSSVLAPRFRQFIEVPLDFYPSHWYINTTNTDNNTTNNTASNTTSNTTIARN